MNLNTSDYWRKLLGIDSGSNDVLKKFNYPHRFLRPLFYLLFGIFMRLFCRIKVKGIDNLPDNPPYIIAPNHSSALDYPVVSWAVGQKRKDLYVLATKFFYDMPFARFFMKIAANLQRLDVDDDFLTGMKVAAAILKCKKSLYINPEGTRSETGIILPFRPGVGMLACEMKVPVVPVYIHNAFKCLPPGSVFPKPCKIEICFGKPLDINKYFSRLKSENAYYVYKDFAEDLQQKVIELKKQYS